MYSSYFVPGVCITVSSPSFLLFALLSSFSSPFFLAPSSISFSSLSPPPSFFLPLLPSLLSPPLLLPPSSTLLSFSPHTPTHTQCYHALGLLYFYSNKANEALDIWTRCCFDHAIIMPAITSGIAQARATHPSAQAKLEHIHSNMFQRK